MKVLKKILKILVSIIDGLLYDPIQSHKDREALESYKRKLK